MLEAISYNQQKKYHSDNPKSINLGDTQAQKSDVRSLLLFRQ